MAKSTRAGAALRAPAAEAMLKQIRAELASVRRTLEKLAASPVAPDASLESSVDSLRRLLSELIESRLEPVIAQVAAIRDQVVSAPRASEALERIEALLADLGALRFEAKRLDYFDPLIHQAVAERRDAAAPAGAVLETLLPGYRTGRGHIVAKARVAVNRKD
jgi:molecular chaperone GrpE (heat shock protein)